MFSLRYIEVLELWYMVQVQDMCPDEFTSFISMQIMKEIFEELVIYYEKNKIEKFHFSPSSLTNYTTRRFPDSAQNVSQV